MLPTAIQTAFLSMQRHVGSARVGDETDSDIGRIRRPLLYAIVRGFQETSALGRHQSLSVSKLARDVRGSDGSNYLLACGA